MSNLSVVTPDHILANILDMKLNFIAKLCLIVSTTIQVVKMLSDNCPHNLILSFVLLAMTSVKPITTTIVAKCT
ncbi:hypothetical protein C3B55_00667 [Candidatus Pseudomonas adelgestsugas]|uniref:Uncharacterized protein n=1 Tax=Candidatus Pseudomonas adelgestsugas TaxID=1302376 RepID=A0ABX5R8N7_9PSED|nr:hypothetical protein C3B55_00667 [Candidatus Pseudomonas adelgestsugas]